MRPAGAGRPPAQDRSTVVTRTKPKTTWTDVPNRPYLDGQNRELPPISELLGGWPKATLTWWETVRVMPHCALWSESDWAFAVDTAFVHRRFHMTDGKDGAPELRARGRMMGVNEEARRALMIRYVDVDEAKPDLAVLAEVTSIKIPAKKRRPLAIDPDVT